MKDHMKGTKPREPVNGIVVNCKKLNVRERPSIDANVLAAIPVGSEIQIDENQSISEFYKVSTSSGLEGFCMKKFITIQS